MKQVRSAIIINSWSKIYKKILLKKFVLKFVIKLKMPKSVSTLQNQTTGCERNIQQSLAQCAVQAGDNDFQFTFSLNGFVNNITTVDLENTSDSITKVLSLFQECEKIVALEKKRRGYIKELRKIMMLVKRNSETVDYATSIQEESIANEGPFTA